MKLRPPAWMTLVLFVAAAVGQTAVSAGTFPGANGKITFSHCDVDVINPDGTGLSILAEATPAGCYAEPAWNASGTKLAYRDARTIRSMNANGSNNKALYSHDTFSGDPTWSADGSVVAFGGFLDTTRGWRIFVVPAAGGTATELSGVDAQDPSYSPDGTKIAYENDTDDSPDVGVMNADGSNPTNITSGAFADDGDFDPSWSPDGTKLTFQRQKQIWTMDADGSDATQLTTGADASHPTWSPDGTKITFASDDDIWVMDTDGGDVTNITSGIHAGERQPPDSPDWGVAPTVHGRSVSLALKGHLQAKGKITVADGFGACLANVAVKITRNGKAVTKTKTTSAGAYEVKLKDRPGKYKATAPKLSPTPGHVCSKAGSPERRHND